VDAIIDNVDPDHIALRLLGKVSNGSHSTAQGLIADLDNAPLEIQQAADEEMQRQDNCQASQTAPKKARKKEAHARVNSADACGRQFRHSHAILKAAISHADADSTAATHAAMYSWSQNNW
jgi:hypothetical protein